MKGNTSGCFPCWRGSSPAIPYRWKTLLKWNSACSNPAQRLCWSVARQPLARRPPDNCSICASVALLSTSRSPTHSRMQERLRHMAYPYIISEEESNGINSSRPRKMKKAAPSALTQSIRLPFDWIDAIAIPVATSIMEAQPIAVVLLFMSLLVTGKSANVPLDAVSIILLLLGLHWWALLVKYIVQRGLDEKLEGASQFFGLLLALALAIVTHRALLADVSGLLLVTVLVLWFWVRGKRRARVEPSEEQLIFSFKLCFIVLLVVLLITLPVNPAIAMPTLAAIALALPLFFVSGLIVLSFVPLSITRHEYRRDAFGTRLDRTRVWSFFLVLTWSLLVVATILLELFAFQPLLTLLTPSINAI